MNDVDELRFGMFAGIQQFPRFAQEAGGTPSTAQILIAGFNLCIGYMSEKTLENTYVLCLSEHKPGDVDGILSMWRSYASQGHGVALVFNTRNVTHPPQAPLKIAKVIYGSQKERLQILEQGLQQWAEITRGVQDDRLYIAAYGAFLFIKSFALMTKHNGFAEEAEWRLIYIPEWDLGYLLTSQFSYHISPRGVEPKLKFKIAPVLGGARDSLSLARLVEFILLGPSVASPIAKAAFCRALQGTCLQHLAVENRVFASTIPLRPTVG
jgi:Protein of unknown function (DUF2971)